MTSEQTPASQSMICIRCPLGCRLEVELQPDRIWKIDGHTCKKGKEHGLQEVTDPRRMVTTTVWIRGALWRRMPVRTAEAVPKDTVMAVCRALHGVELEAPVRTGDIVLDNAAGTGIPIVATRSLDRVG